MNKISYFWKIKTTETLGHAYTYTHMCKHAQALRTHASCMHMHTRACVRMPMYVYVCMKHAFVELEHACAYACMHTHTLGFPWPLFSKNSLFNS